MATFLLSKQGCEVLQARDGREALEMARRVAPDVILLDIQLPFVDGYGGRQTLRGDRPSNGSPFVALTSYAMAAEPGGHSWSGCDGCLTKPIEPERLAAQVADFLRLRSERERGSMSVAWEVDRFVCRGSAPAPAGAAGPLHPLWQEKPALELAGSEDKLTLFSQSRSKGPCPWWGV